MGMAGGAARVVEWWRALALALVLLLLPITALAAGWTPSASLPGARGYHTATPLLNGKVLVVGGWDGTIYRDDSVLYDPATNAMTPAGFVPGGRGYLHTATLLRDGRVLVAGGLSGSSYVSVLALYDPASSAWSDGGAIVDTRYWHTATLLPNGKVLMAGGLGFPQVSELYDPVSRVSSPTPAPATARYDHTATLLPNGKVLLVGGRAPSSDAELASVELFDPATNTWTPAAGLGNARFGHTATLLPNGKVMVTGGRSTASAFGATELYDPATNTWTTAAPMTPRFDHAATLLPGGRVLVSGGMSSSFSAIALAELYDPAANQWYVTPDMGQSRLAHTATLLATGRVFVAGGSGAPYRSSTELYDPAAASWSATGTLAQARQRGVATLLPDGGVLVAGGFGSAGVLATAERYDPAAGTWSARASMATARQAATLTPLADGKLLVAGGSSATGVTPTTGALASVERYDPATNTWSAAGNLATPRYLQTATLLLDGRVLVVGGENNGAALASVEIYEPGSNAFVAGPPLATARRSHSATLLPSGKVLVAGGTNGAALASAELFDPVTNSWAPAGSLATARHAHAATLLPDGRVLASGGQGAAALASAERYDPATNAWSATGAMATARHSHTATLLPSGHILVVGAQPTVAGAERYDPVSGSFAAESAPAPGRSLHAAVLLPTGKVLVAGGWMGAAAVASAEVYDGGRSPVPARQPQLASTPALVVPGEFQATGSGFLPVVTAGDGGTADSASNSPVFEVQRVEDGQRRYLVVNATRPITDTTFRGLVALFPPGPLMVRTWVNGVPSTARMSRAPAPPSAPGTPTATGGTFATVTFTPAAYDGGNPIQSYVATASPGGTMGSCSRACTSIDVYGLAPGTYTFVVQARNAAGLGRASAASNPVTIAGVPTQTSVGATAFSLRFLDPVTLQANVYGSGPTPTGSVAFLVDDVPVPGCAAVPLAAGGAQCSLPGGLAVGPRAIKVTFAGGSGYLGSVGTNTLTIEKGITDSFLFNVRPRFAFVGQSVEVTARVLPDLGSPNGPTGTITVSDGLATCTVPAPGPGRCNLVPTTAGLKTVRATYLGDGNWATGISPATSLTVMAPFAATPRPSLITSRSWHSATLLLDGRLLVAGGISGTPPQAAYASAEIYDPATRSWSATGTLASPRWGHGAVQLPNGRVLVAGGTNAVSGGALLPSGELWDPASSTWIPTAPLFTPRTRPVLVRLDNGKVLVVGGTTDGAASGATVSVELYDPATNTFAPTGSLATPREGHTATRLADGSVLVAGGRNAAGTTLATAERFDPASGTWSPAASLATARRDAAATLLDDGTVLLVAGANGTFTPLASAERYDPDADAWELAGSIVGPRTGHSLSRLPNGLAVVLGGSDGAGAPLDAWFYEPLTKTWTASGAMPAYRYGHTATWLANGELLLVGGAPQNAGQNVFVWTAATDGWLTLASLPAGVMLGTMTAVSGDRVMVAGGTTGVFCCDLSASFFFDRSLGTWTTGPSMKGARYRHTATLLADYSVLVVGGAVGPPSAPVERYDPRVNAWRAAAPLPMRTRHTATLLHNGRVLVAGGRDETNARLAQAWIYDPVQDAWSAAGAMSVAREEHAATLLANGKVLVTAGSTDERTRLASAEVYDPATNIWSPAGALPSARSDHTATLLANGKVLVAGGYTGGQLLESAALYDPATNGWTPVPDMAFARYGHVAVRLADGTVVVVGGDSTGTTAERYFPLDNVWRSAGVGLSVRTGQHMAVEMSDGSVLVAGGRPDGFAPQATPAVSSFVPGFAPAGSQDSGGFDFAAPYLLPSAALVLENGSFAPAATASGGGLNDSPSNVPVIELLRPDGSARRVIPASQADAFGPTDYAAKIGALAGFPTGPVRVRAWVNGRLGTAASSRFATGPGRLAAPVALGGAKALLSFDPARYTGGAVVLQYTATASPGGATATCSRPCSNFEFATLPPGTYTFTIVQQTAVGTSPASPPSNAVTIQATPIDVAPATLPVPVPSQPYGPVQFTASNGTPPYTFAVASGALPPGLTLSGAGVLLGTPLGSGSFTFTVRALDSRAPASGGPLAGERSYTLTSSPGAVPGAPQSVTAVPGNGRAYVAFVPPASSGDSPVTGYRVQSNPPGGFDQDGDTTALAHVVTGLANGVAYTFTVEAWNAAGAGPASSASAAVTPGVPTLALSGSSPVDFGSVAPGGASQATTLVLTNPGPTGAALSSITTTGDFGVSHTCGNVLLPGSCSLNLQFVPAGTGLRAGSLAIASDAAASPIQRPLQGSGGTPATCAGFNDVAPTDPFCGNVEWLANRQITLGCAAGLYCPVAPVSRLAMAAFMTRLGTALSAPPLVREQVLGALDVDAGPVVCATADHAVGTSPRTAHLDGVLAAQAATGGTTAFALRPVASFDGGATWTPLTAQPMRLSIRPLQWGSARAMQALDLTAGQVVRFGLQLARDSLQGTVDVVAGRCVLRVRLDNRNGTGSPRDPR